MKKFAVSGFITLASRQIRLTIGQKIAAIQQPASCHTSMLSSRSESDRPLVVPEGAVNFAFLGQFAETPRDTIFTTEYSIRTGMEAVYTLMNVDRGVPEVWGSKYDVRELLRAAYYAVDKKPIDELPLSLKEKVVLKKVIKAVEGTDLEILLKESGLLR